MKQKDVVRLSKLMSVALRHDPAAFDLTLDDNGWVDFELLVAALRTRPKWAWVKADHVRHIIDSSDKQRFELNQGQIRARYGHSRAVRPSYQTVTPPSILYHGTPRRNLDVIRRNGLKAMSRQYVHLSATTDMALNVGQRRDNTPALLRIRAVEAHAAGVAFGTPSGAADDVYLVEMVPPEFIEFP